VAERGIWATDSRLPVALLVVAVGVVLADSSVVVLALPDMLDQFHTSVDTIAWVITAFNLSVAVCAVPGMLLGLRFGARRLSVAGALLFAAASAACAVSPSVGWVIAGRCVQAVGGAALAGSALELLVERLGDERRAARIWASAAAVGAAVGPMAGGALTDAFDWRAIFVVQVPLGLAAVLARNPVPKRPQRVPLDRPPIAPNVALGLVAGGLSAALFLLVLLFVQGYGDTPIRAAVAISVIPLAAIVVSIAVPGEGMLATRAAGGSLLIAGGLAALAVLPGAQVAWTLLPQAMIGAGLALALPALSHAALQDPPLAIQGAWSIAARHAGVVIGLLLLTPLLVSDLNTQSDRAQAAGAGVVLASQLPFSAKLELGNALEQQVAQAGNADVPDLAPVFRRVHAPPAQRPIYAAIEHRLTDQVKRAATRAFRRAFLLGAVLALAAVVPLLAIVRRRPMRASLVVAAAAVALVPGAIAVAAGGVSYGPAAAADPCAGGHWAKTGSVTSKIALSALNGAACYLHVQVAALALSLQSTATLNSFQQSHNVSEAKLDAAVKAGLERAIADGQRAGDLNSLEASVLSLTLDHLPPSWLRSQLPSALGLVQGGGSL
jgi:MFS family permease